jgi:hypothetical protein
MLNDLPLLKTAKRELRDQQFRQAVLHKHSVLSVLSSVVMAFPHEIEHWMVPIVMAIAGSASNPSPIRELVKNTFSEFKKSHQDTWAIDKQLFSEEQLTIITDLIISPSYYA